MALRDVKNILLRAAMDPDFRAVFFEDPDTVFRRYDLTEEEKESLRAIQTEDQLALVCQSTEEKGDFLASDIRI